MTKSEKRLSQILRQYTEENAERENAAIVILICGRQNNLIDTYIDFFEEHKEMPFEDIFQELFKDLPELETE